MYRLTTIFAFLLISNMLLAQVSIKESPIAIENLSNPIDVNFKLAGGLILMDAENDGEKGAYILDTGAPCVIVNKIVKEEDSSLLAVGVGGQTNVSESEIEKFRLGKFIKNQIKCLSLDISHIEELKKTKIAGLIGYDIIKDKELLFDYDNLMVSFLDDKKIENHKGQKRLKTLPFRMFGHMPIIQVKIGNKKFKFGIDTGAEVNVINVSKAKKIDEKLYSEVSTANIQSLDDHTTNVMAIELDQIEVSKREVYEDLRFIIADLTTFNNAYGVRLDGLLGYSFLKERLHSIDFKNKELVIWEDQSSVRKLSVSLR